MKKMKLKLTVEAILTITEENVLQDLGRIPTKKALIKRELDYYKETLGNEFWEPGTKVKYNIVEVEG